jgi:hypothetical protein
MNVLDNVMIGMITAKTVTGDFVSFGMEGKLVPRRSSGRP